MAAGGGVQREADGVTVLLARVAVAHDAPNWRLHGNVVFQKPLDPNAGLDSISPSRAAGATP